jgi:hypothetical protein
MLNRLKFPRFWIAVPAVLAMAFIAAPASAACMKVTYQNVPQVAQEDRGRDFEVVVPDRLLPMLEAEGLEEVACEPALKTAEGRQAKRDEICELAHWGNSAVQEQIRRAWGVHPGLLCLAVETEVGRWTGERRNWAFERGTWPVETDLAGPSGEQE